MAAAPTPPPVPGATPAEGAHGHVPGAPPGSGGIGGAEPRTRRAPDGPPGTIDTATTAAGALPPTGLDPDIGGAQALAAVRTCFAPARLAEHVRFGASLSYDLTGRSIRAFFSDTDGIRPTERRCLGSKLIGLSAGGAPTRPSIIIYSFWLDPAAGKVKARLR
jgi:hypothetical protein